MTTMILANYIGTYLHLIPNHRLIHHRSIQHDRFRFITGVFITDRLVTKHEKQFAVGAVEAAFVRHSQTTAAGLIFIFVQWKTTTIRNTWTLYEVLKLVSLSMENPLS